MPHNVDMNTKRTIPCSYGFLQPPNWTLSPYPERNTSSFNFKNPNLLHQRSGANTFQQRLKFGTISTDGRTMELVFKGERKRAFMQETGCKCRRCFWSQARQNFDNDENKRVCQRASSLFDHGGGSASCKCLFWLGWDVVKSNN